MKFTYNLKDDLMCALDAHWHDFYYFFKTWYMKEVPYLNVEIITVNNAFIITDPFYKNNNISCSNLFSKSQLPK